MSNIPKCFCRSVQGGWRYVISLLLVAFFVVDFFISNNPFWLLMGVISVFVFILCSNTAVHTITVENFSTTKTVCAILVAILTVLSCILPMKLFPIWNGEIPGHRNQYELMAENLLEGRLSFDYGDEDQLEGLENPYDPNERKETGVRYHWDHAFYKGKYYMYFGIVPVFLLFLPYRIITGEPLTTYQATQFFAAAIIIGLFVLFRLLTRLFFRKMPFAVYILLSVAFSIMSVWYCVAEPALYCTAITAAIALEVWSIYFYIRAVWLETLENKQILSAAIGALLGALVFGCRPPIALANMLVIPMLFVFINKRRVTLKLLGKLCIAALPYLVVGVLLMMYNYVRFDNPFEFGQKYQLTVADQTKYGFELSAPAVRRLLDDGKEHLFGKAHLTKDFPYLECGGVFLNFPILLLITSSGIKTSRNGLKQNNLRGLILTILVTIIAITAVDILWTPYLLERYRMDVYFLAGIACFISIGLWYRNDSFLNRGVISAMVCVMSIVTVLCSVLFCLRIISAYYPETIDTIEAIIFGRSW